MSRPYYPSQIIKHFHPYLLSLMLGLLSAISSPRMFRYGNWYIPHLYCCPSYSLFCAIKTVQILSRADPSPTGLVHQYRQEIITKLSSMPPSFSPGLDHDLRNELVCRALEIADAIAHDGKTYCKSVVEILLQTERESVRATPTLSPTLSSKSGASNSTKKSSKGRGRGGVVEGAIEMILTRVRSGEFLIKGSWIPFITKIK